jgi:hypothetical protein
VSPAHLCVPVQQRVARNAHVCTGGRATRRGAPRRRQQAKQASGSRQAAGGQAGARLTVEPDLAVVDSVESHLGAVVGGPDACERPAARAPQYEE